MRKVLLFIFCLFIWCLIAWPFDLSRLQVDWQLLVAGGVISLLGALILGDVFEKRKRKHFFLIRWLWGLLYIPILFFYILIANLDVLYRVIHPKMPIKPGIVKVKTKLKSDAARTVLANSITLTPGTLTVDITKDGYLYVHCIYLKELKEDYLQNKIITRFENIIEKVFE